MCDDVIDISPLRTAVVGAIVGTNATFTIAMTTALDVSGDVFRAFVYAGDVVYEGVTTVTASTAGYDILCDWTGAQTTAMGVGFFEWKLTWLRDGRTFNLVQSRFQVSRNAE